MLWLNWLSQQPRQQQQSLGETYLRVLVARYTAVFCLVPDGLPSLVTVGRVKLTVDFA
jgi:hypothetical protein